jgi:hypothetical protein
MWLQLWRRWQPWPITFSSSLATEIKETEKHEMILL